MPTPFEPPNQASRVLRAAKGSTEISEEPKKSPRKKRGPKRKPGAVERSRTSDLLITNQLLYQLSYNGKGSDSIRCRVSPPAAPAAPWAARTPCFPARHPARGPRPH